MLESNNVHKLPVYTSPLVNEMAETLGHRLRNEYDRGFIYGENVGRTTAMKAIRKAEDKALWIGTIIGGAVGSVITATVILWWSP